jgi:hypothetical protein
MPALVPVPEGMKRNGGTHKTHTGSGGQSEAGRKRGMEKWHVGHYVKEKLERYCLYSHTN